MLQYFMPVQQYNKHIGVKIQSSCRFWHCPGLGPSMHIHESCDLILIQ
jgi:hypothetical protein